MEHVIDYFFHLAVNSHCIRRAQDLTHFSALSIFKLSDFED